MAAAGSCTGSDEDVAAQFAEPCDGDCAEGLDCVNGLCTTRCGMPSDCMRFNATAICDSNYCYLPCMSTFNCPNGLACTQQQTSARMTCRPR